MEPVAETFGLTASSLSRRFKRASARKLAELQERDLSGYDLVGLFLDGKTFGDDEMVIALGVTLSGEKVVLGFVQTATENEAVCTSFLRGLVERGLKYRPGPAGGDGRREGAAQGGGQGVREEGGRAAVPLAQAGERAGLPADRAEAGVQAEAERGVREADVRGGQGGLAADPGGAGGGECLGGGAVWTRAWRRR